MKTLISLLIKFYQKFLSLDQGYLGLLLGTQGRICRFSPTCSQYALEAFQKHSFFKAFVMGLKRLSKCHPLHEGGLDPVI